MPDGAPAARPTAGLEASRPQQQQRQDGALDLTGAAIIKPACEDDEAPGQSKRRDAPSIALPQQDADCISHIALDIGGSLIKLVYFSPDAAAGDSGHAANGRSGGKLHFVKFETADTRKVLEFIESKGLHKVAGAGGRATARIKATGGGAFKYADIFEERLGLQLEKEDEMDCLVAGCNFLLRAIYHEAFTFDKDGPNYITTHSDSDVFPYLLVNIGSGVSMLKVTSDSEHERVSGSSLGGGTFWGLCRLLTRVHAFDEMLELSARGDNAKVDMLVGDIYGDRDYSSIGLSASTIASSFGKVISEGKDLEDYDPADIAMALCRMVSYNISQLAYLNAKRFNLKRIFFGGFFIRGHPYTMDTISFAINFWSKGEMQANFLRHEGFLGAVGAFLSVHPMAGVAASPAVPASTPEPRKVRARFVERFTMGAPYSGGEVRGPAIQDMDEKVSWVEKFVRVGTAATEAARSEHDRALEEEAVHAAGGGGGGGGGRGPPARSASAGSDLAVSPSPASASRMQLHVGVLQYTPAAEPFPLLADPLRYEPNTLDMHANVACPMNMYSEEKELDYWLQVLGDQIPTVVEKAVASEQHTDDARRRAAAFGRAFGGHVSRLQAEPQAYGELGLADLLEMREECLREFGFWDVYRVDKERENAAALEVLPDLLRELDSLAPGPRLAALVQGSLAANIFDWGARATVQLYQNGTILEIYREARARLSKRPWRVDQLDPLAAKWLSAAAPEDLVPGGVPAVPFRRVIMFVDNAGADVVLGMLPLARELLRSGAEVVLAANSLPAINDITAGELRELIAAAGTADPVIRAAWAAGGGGPTGAGPEASPPPLPGLPRRVPSSGRLLDLAAAAQQPFGSPTRLLGPGKEPIAESPALEATEVDEFSADDAHAAAPAVTAAIAHTTPRNGSNGAAANRQVGQLSAQLAGSHIGVDSSISGNNRNTTGGGTSAPVSAPGHRRHSSFSRASGGSSTGSSNGAGLSDGQLGSVVADMSPSRPVDVGGGGCGGGSPAAAPAPAASQHSRAASLYVVDTGQGSPCLDLRRVSAPLADATVGTDLVVIEGMGRAVHTNLRTRFKCDALKLAMIKNQHLAEALFQGQVYDCVCIYEPSEGSGNSGRP